MAPGAAPLEAQDPATDAEQVLPPCESGRVSHVFVDNHSIFDPEDLEEAGWLEWAYDLANTLHVRTRADFIRDELLLDVGDCFDPLLAEESGRLLRSYPFLAQADVYGVEQADGDVHLVVDTQDEWTTQVDLGLSFDDGLNLEAISITEENFLGRGILVEGFLRQRREREDLGGRLELPRIFDTRLDLALGGGQTRAGSFFNQSLVYPFVGEVGRLAMRQGWSRRDEIFPFATGEEEGFTHLALPMLEERQEIAAAGRIGEPGNLTIFGLALTRSVVDFGDLSGVEVVRDGDFGAGEPASPEQVAILADQTRPRTTSRVNLLFGQRNVRFVRVRGLDALAGEQDVRLGTDVALTLGRGVEAFIDPELPSADDLFTRIRFFAGSDPGTSYVFFNLAAQGRQIMTGGQERDGWRDVLVEGDLYAYVRSRRMPGQTFFARVSASGGWRMDVPFQLTLGGREGVRGWNEDELPGGRRIVATLEDRIFLGWPAPDFMDFGLTLFADVGRMWPGDVPFGVDSGWRTSVGAGIRVGFPPGSRGATRIDVALPLAGDNRKGPVLRVTLFELLGVLRGFYDTQMQRSRQVTIGPDAFVVDPR